MSKASVRFFTMDYEMAKAGEEVRFGFNCPKKGVTCDGHLIKGKSKVAHDPQGKKGRPQWKWNGDRDNPTFEPSINCGGCWHGHIREGRLLTLHGTEEPEYVEEKRKAPTRELAKTA